MLSQVSNSLRSSIFRAQQLVLPGMNAMLVNGLAVNVDEFDLYGKRVPRPYPARRECHAHEGRGCECHVMKVLEIDCTEL